MRRRLLALILGIVTVVVAPTALARYAICRVVYQDGCLASETCYHFDDEGNQTGIAWVTYECP